MLDETTKTGQDTSSGGPGQSSGGKGGTTSKDKGRLYTAADIAKVISDAKSEAGRLQKAAEQERDNLKQDLESNKTRLDALERETNESRLAEARAGGDDQLRVYQREEAVRKRERQVDESEQDITRQKGQLKSDREKLDQDRGVVSIAFTAAKHGLEVEDLEPLGISDPDTLDKVAEKLAAAKPKGEGEDADRQAYQALETDAERAAFVEAHPDFEPEGGEGEGGEGFTPDSGEGAGGGAKALTVESVEKSSMAALEKQMKPPEK